MRNPALLLTLDTPIALGAVRALRSELAKLHLPEPTNGQPSVDSLLEHIDVTIQELAAHVRLYTQVAAAAAVNPEDL
jgi:hypothetical protein